MKNVFFKMLIASMVLAFAGYTVAQPEGGDKAPDGDALMDDVLNAGGDGDGEEDGNTMSVDKEEGEGAESECQAYPLELPDSDLAAAIRAIFEDIYDGLKTVVELQKLARKQNDVIKLNCVNDKLLQIKQLTNIAEKAKTEFVAVGSNEGESKKTRKEIEAERSHQHERVATSGEEVCRLVEEAKLCLGEELIYVGPLRVDVEEPDLDDPESTFPGDDVDLEPPAYASPFA